MSSKSYTPETIDVKMAYVTSFDPGGAHKFLAHMVAEMTTGHAADFDRWLEEHDRSVAADALRKAVQKYGFTMVDNLGDPVEVVFQEDLTDEIARLALEEF